MPPLEGGRSVASVSDGDQEGTMAATEQRSARGGEYIEAGGIRTYYETAGAGEPLVLLHGGMCTVETFDGQTPALAGAYRVYVPERRGHGRTPDVDGPITYDVMTVDTIAFMEAIGIRSAHLVGFSDGALVALLVALQRPDLVRRLVLIGQAVNFEHMRPEMEAMMEGLSVEDLPPMLRALYAAASPDGPEHFDVVFAKLASLWRTDPGIGFAQLEQVTAPTLVLLGDRDLISLEHAAAMQRALPEVQVGVVPGATHGLPMEKPELTNRLVLDFLAG
jgi:pimeloyl-ACP methyl ester carboxylesterase